MLLHHVGNIFDLSMLANFEQENDYFWHIYNGRFCTLKTNTSNVCMLKRVSISRSVRLFEFIYRICPHTKTNNSYITLCHN